MPGENPYSSASYIAKALMKGVRAAAKLQAKIMRAIEQQASQVLQTGTITLTDSSGTAIYTIDYAPKAAHFPTAGTAWSSASSTKLADIQSLANVIRTNGLKSPDMLIFGETAYEAFIQDQAVKDRLDNRRIEGNGIVPLNRMGNGGIYRGTVEIGNYKYDMFTYDGQYKDPQTGNAVKFVDNGKVIVRASMGRLDATFGSIPKITGRVDSRVPAGLTQRLSVPGAMLDATISAWVTEDDETLMIQAGTRPLMIPTDIDSFGCLTTGL